VTAGAAADAGEGRRARPDAVRRLLQVPSTAVALVVIAALGLAALCAPFVSPYDPLDQNMADFLSAPGARHWFGTDQFGRDILSRVIWGGRLTLQVGVIAVAISAAIGIPLGLTAGFYGRAADFVIMRAIDLLLAFPGILLALGVVAVLGGSLANVMIAVGIAGVPQFTRIVRAAVLGVRALPYVEAAQGIGCADRVILWRHVLPNVVAPAMVLATTSGAGAIITGAALSFLGLGARPPAPEWGAMLSTGREYLRHAPWMSVFPGLAIMVAVIAINVVGDRLRDVLDPRLRLD
jgi:peptide/nickel transport system permease protein